MAEFWKYIGGKMGINLMNLNLEGISKMTFIKNKDGTFGLDLDTKAYSYNDNGLHTECVDVKMEYKRVNIISLDIDVLPWDEKYCTFMQNIL